jgi:hypothetical protein
MNFAKVFRRHHQRNEPISTVGKSLDAPSLMNQHRYPRSFSYHLPSTEQTSPSKRTSNFIPYRIGLSSDRTLLTPISVHHTDDIVHLPMKSPNASSPKMRKDRRCQSHLNANKRWLFRSMETLDAWKGKVFAQKVRISKFVLTFDGYQSIHMTHRIRALIVKF